MSKNITFFYNYLSPYTYLAHTQLAGLIERTGAKIEYVPVDVLDVMKQVNNTPTTLQSAVKGQYAFKDIGRWAERYQVPFSRNPYFGKFDPTLAHQAAIVASDRGYVQTYNQALFDAVWVKGVNLGEIDIFQDYLKASGIENAAELLVDAQQTTIADRFQQNSSRAVAAGVFGTPSFSVGHELFFGNDRLDFLEQALTT